MINSMTGFASAKGELAPWRWNWELRGVNGKGLDMRLRVPDWLDGLEAGLRKQLALSVARGNITLTLRVTKGEDNGGARINIATMGMMLEALAAVEKEAIARGMTLAPSRASDLLPLRGMFDASAAEEDTAPLVSQIKAEFGGLVAGFAEMRASEGAVLFTVMNEQLSRIEVLTAQAADLAEARKGAVADALRSNLAKVLDNTDAGGGVDPGRVAQELAMLAVKSDVTEEIDRLGAHVEATRDLLAKGGTVGRKLDFLMQEFNREANTLCSKAQSVDLTAVGLELKAVIDQMREQVQNVE
ncbi:MAG: YicC family protein [Rhodobacteraceae bacterium]|nr:YicC family protein [Paracoccaceae bacterium]